jgi:hypothetical protein
LIDTRTTDGHDPPLAGFFHHKPLAKRIFCRDSLAACGIRTGGGKSEVLVWAGHRWIFLWYDMANPVPQRSWDIVAEKSRVFLFLRRKRSIFLRHEKSKR